MRTILLLGSTLLLTLCSCSVGTWIVGKAEPQPFEVAAPDHDYTVYFRAFDNPWVGRSRQELLDALGPPDAVYEARHRFAEFEAGIPASTYIYTSGLAYSGHCIDAYVVDQPTGTVIKYYCR